MNGPFFHSHNPGTPCLSNASHNLIPERCKQIWEERKYVCKISAKDVAKLSSNVFFSPDICSIFYPDLFGLLVCWTEQEIPTPNWEISWVGHWPMVNQLLAPDVAKIHRFPYCFPPAVIIHKWTTIFSRIWVLHTWMDDIAEIIIIQQQKTNNWQFIKITFTNDKHQ